MRIGTRKINMLKDALRTLLVSRRITLAGHAFGPNDHHFAGLHVAHVDGVDQIECAGFRSENVGQLPSD